MDRPTTVRVAGLAGLVFLILGSYAIARPAVESLFLAEHGAKGLPTAWLGVALGSLVVVTVYNRWAARTDLVVLFGVASVVSAAGLTALLLGRGAGLPGGTLLLYLWKDLYIVVLIEIFWSFANSVIPRDLAKWIYGVFCVIGSLGGMAGNLTVGLLAARYGTAQGLWAVVPLLLLAGAGCALLNQAFPPGTAHRAKGKPSLTEGFGVLRRSRTLWLLMGLIAMSQVVITLIDYQMNLALELHYPDTDTRTEVIGRIYAAIDLASMALQLATGPVLRLLGVGAVLLLIPGLLGVAVGAYAAVPRFAAMAASKVSSKAFDYSLFRAAKEILYIPLSHAERTQGKAFVDMCSYRVAKGACSLLLLGLAVWGSPGWVLLATLAGIAVWIGVTAGLVKNTAEGDDKPMVG
jgi:AAA family ATP:ADP antiporter